MLDGQLHVVARAHERDHDAELERELAPQRAHAVEQVAALARVDEVDEVERDLELERLDAHVGRDALGRVGRERRRLGLDVVASAAAWSRISSSLGSRVASSEQHAADDEERHLRQAGHDRDQADRAAARAAACACGA